MDLLRFSTAGSVDDGKSTLIGRLLYDTKSIFQDTLDSIERTSNERGDDYLDLALVTDGLKEEREQGITIDVAYRYFATPKRKFILADTPGHIQYTRNMVTGASTVNLAIILIDARNGVIEQTRRHTFISNLLRIQHLVVCVNKMDLVDYSQEAFEKVVAQYQEFTSKLQIPDITYIPISALKGDNVVNRSEKMDWYEGPTLLYRLEHVQISDDNNHVDSRFPVQYVIRPQSEEHRDYRGYAGKIAGGVWKAGDEVMVLPSGFTSKIKKIDSFDGEVDKAFAPMSVTMLLEDEIDISRGDMLVKPGNQGEMGQDLELMVCWMNNKPLVPRGKYKIRQTTRDARCMVKEVEYKVDINTLHRVQDDKNIGLNDIGRIKVRTTLPLVFDSYGKNKNTGSIILVDEFTNETVAAGMII
ncbi:MAG: sulfate adenylyltransferase subunit CysN [Bacteroidota bacterium]